MFYSILLQMPLTQETALDAMIRLGVPLHLNVGIEEVDSVIGCGLKPCEFYEIVGELAVGKTQVCYSVVVDQLLNTGFNVVWFDMNGSFRSERLLAYIEQNSSNMNRLHLLERVFVCRISEVSSLLSALKCISDSTEMDRVRLVIVDNIGCMLEKTIWTMREGGADVQRIVLKALSDLTDAGITVITTNHLVYWRGFPTPSLGQLWLKGIPNRMLLEKRDHSRALRIFSV